MGTTQVFAVRSVLGAAMLAAAIDDGIFGSADRRLLLVSSTAEHPETYPSLHDTPGFAQLTERFDEVIDWNTLLAPLHPAGWYPPAAELPLLGRLVRLRLGLEDGEGLTELVLDDLSATPGSAIAALLPGCPITVVSDSLLAWGPPARALTSEQAGRATRLLHLPVLDGLRPLLLTDAAPADATSPRTIPVHASHLVAHLAELPAVPVADDAALLVGERPGVSDTRAAELLARVAARGIRDAVLVPHPLAGPQDHHALPGLADELRVRLTVTGDGLPAEALLARSRPALVVSGISPTLVLARDLFGHAVATVGSDKVLARRKPGPERISATIVHAGVPTLAPDGTLIEPAPASLAALVDAVSYTLAPDLLPELREGVSRYLATHDAGPYLRRERLVALGLAAADPAAPPQRTPVGNRRTLGRLARGILR